MAMSVDALLRGSEDLASNNMRKLSCGSCFVDCAGALCVGGLLIPLSATMPGT